MAVLTQPCTNNKAFSQAISMQTNEAGWSKPSKDETNMENLAALRLDTRLAPYSPGDVLANRYPRNLCSWRSPTHGNASFLSPQHQPYYPALFVSNKDTFEHCRRTRCTCFTEQRKHVSINGYRTGINCSRSLRRQSPIYHAFMQILQKGC